MQFEQGVAAATRACHQQRHSQTLVKHDLISHVYLLPVVSSSTHKVAAEVSKVGNYRGGELLCCMDGRANPLMDPKAEALSLSSLCFTISPSVYLSLV